MKDGYSCLVSRRGFLRQAAVAGAGGLALAGHPWRGRALGIDMDAIPRGERPRRSARLEVLNPRNRVPLSFIIDDSTCLVNMGHFCMPQFAEAWPERESYRKPWRDWPREIPDSFVRKFGEWSRDHGVKGKYSVVPYPACVGWLDRFLPGWGHRELQQSLALVRDLMMPDWDIHSEMISHTRVLNLNTGRPHEAINRHTMENSHPAEPVTVDYLASYIGYSLQLLKRVGLPCEGFTTPGGFGNLVKAELSLAAIDALRSVFSVEVPHYFKYLETGRGSSTAPRVEHASGLNGDDPRCVVNVVGGTGDWFGGWDGVSYGDVAGSADRFITEDYRRGRMVEMIDKGEPAIMLCHWPGIYCNGAEVGFEIYKRAVTRLNEGYGDRTIWMKLSEIARYWAAKELTASDDLDDGGVRLRAPFGLPDFTVRIPAAAGQRPLLRNRIGFGTDPSTVMLREVRRREDLVAGTWVRGGEDYVVACFDLPKGESQLALGRG